MRYLLSLILIASYGCGSVTAGLAIPPGQQFVLGEYETSAYRAKLENIGTQPVTVVVRGRTDERPVNEELLAPGAKASLEVAPDEIVYFRNPNAAEARVRVDLNQGVEGMRNELLDGSAPTTTADNFAAVPGTPDTESPPRDRTVATLPPGARLIIGEGTRSGYSAEINLRRGPGVEIAVRNRRTGRQLSGFGLGRNSRETITVGPEAILDLRNGSETPVKLRVVTSKPVVGARTVLR